MLVVNSSSLTIVLHTQTQVHTYISTIFELASRLAFVNKFFEKAGNYETEEAQLRRGVGSF